MGSTPHSAEHGSKLLSAPWIRFVCEHTDGEQSDRDCPRGSVTGGSGGEFPPAWSFQAEAPEDQQGKRCERACPRQPPAQQSAGQRRETPPADEPAQNGDRDGIAECYPADHGQKNRAARRVYREDQSPQPAPMVPTGGLALSERALATYRGDEGDRDGDKAPRRNRHRAAFGPRRRHRQHGVPDERDEKAQYSGEDEPRGNPSRSDEKAQRRRLVTDTEHR